MSEKKIIQRGMFWKLRKGEQSILCPTCRPDRIHIPVKLHDPNCYRVMGCTRMFGKKSIKGA